MFLSQERLAKAVAFDDNRGKDKAPTEKTLRRVPKVTRGVKRWGKRTGNQRIAAMHIRDLDPAATSPKRPIDRVRDVHEGALRMWSQEEADVSVLYKELNRRLRAELAGVTDLTAGAVKEAMKLALGKDGLYPYARLLLDFLAEVWPLSRRSKKGEIHRGSAMKFSTVEGVAWAR
jgi:hypothetical protein